MNIKSKLYDYFLKINNLNKILIYNFILLRYSLKIYKEENEMKLTLFKEK